MLSTQKCYIAQTILLSLAAILLIVCSLAPRWLQTTCGSMVHDYSLWYIRICPGDVCETWTYSRLHQEQLVQLHPDPREKPPDADTQARAKKLRLSKQQMVDTEIEVTVAFALNLLAGALVCLFLYKRRRLPALTKLKRPPKSLYMYWACLIVVVTAVILQGISFARFASINLTLSSIYKVHAYHDCAVSAPYSIIVLGLAALADILAAIFGCISICNLIVQRCRNRDANTDDVTNDLQTENAQGQQMVNLLPRDDSEITGYADPVKPKYVMLCTHAYPDK